MVRPTRQPADIRHILLRYGFKELGALFGHSVAEVRGAEAVASGQAQAITANAKNRPRRLRRVLQELGPGFIKFGQFLATQVSQMPSQYVQEFRKLQIEPPSFSLEAAQKVLQEELDKSADQLFSAFSSTPIASSILSQVYSASLPDGTAVAVKIQRPGIKEIILDDIALLREIAKLVGHADQNIPSVNPDKIVDAFEKAIFKELDFRHEATAINQFLSIYLNAPLFVAPRSYENYSSELVVTMDLVKGIKISDDNALDAAGVDRVRAADNGLQVMLSQMFEYGLFHGDPRPSNVFVLPDERIAYVDYGLSGTLNPDQRVGMLKLLLSLVEQDTNLAIEGLRDLAVIIDNKTADTIRPQLETLLKRSLNQALGDINFGWLVSDFFGALDANGLHMPHDLALLIKAFATSESVGLRLNPEFNLVAATQPYLRQLLSEELKPRALFKRIRSISGRRTAITNKSARWKHGAKNMVSIGSNQGSYALVIAALILAGAFLAPLEGLGLFGLNALAVVAFASAIILSTVLVVSIWRERRAQSKRDRDQSQKA